MLMQNPAPPGGRIDSDPFLLWNLRLLEAFFSPATRNDEAWLQVGPAELDALGPDLGGDEGFLAAVVNGAPWARPFPGADAGRLFVERACLLADQRRLTAPRPVGYVDPGKLSPAYEGRNAPNYLPYLAALVRSAAVAQDSYYQHLRDALGFKAHWGSEQMTKLEVVWRDLERWTVSTGGDFGHFKFRVLGGFRLIGVPRSQSIVSVRDQGLVGRVFAQAGLKPGQRLGPVQLEAIRAVARYASFLSSGFREALSEAEYEEAIDSRLKGLFRDWDGSLPTPAQASAAAASESRGGREDETVTVCLSVRNTDELAWSIHWRVPALRDAGILVLRYNDHEWMARLAGTTGAGTEGDEEALLQEAAARALDESGRRDVRFDALIHSGSGAEVDAGELALRRRLLRVLTWDYDPITQRDELRERPLPLHGPAYLLAPPENAQRLLDYLDREAVVHQRLPAEGLPKGWVIACVLDCSTVTDSQRETLPDGQTERAAPKALRLVGGRSVSRAGARQYLAYDLPEIELDAPVGTDIEAPGLVLIEEPKDSESRSTIRRFKIESFEKGVLAFDLCAVSAGSRLEEPTRLRVAPGGGTYVDTGARFALDRFGGAALNGAGLSGILATPGHRASLPAVGSYEIGEAQLGRQVGSADASKAASVPAALFLDALARAGSVAFGSARDQLTRLLMRECAKAGAVEILLDLRRRGHLELEADHKGHLVRVHAVEPTLYSLPILSRGRPVLGVLGTLRTEHWQWLADLDGIAAVWSRQQPDQLDAWRITLPSEAALDLALEGGFAWSASPQAAIAAWSASHGEMHDVIARWGVHDLGTAGATAEKLSAATGRYSPARNGIALDDGIMCQLFRMEDLETRRHQVYALGIRQESGPPRYAFVRDSRWGTWLALCAFGRYVRDFWRLPDAAPWPLPYVPASGTLWVPARAGMPLALDRALTLCSGTAPEVVEGKPEQGSGCIVLRHDRSFLESPVISMVYEQMAAGRWLAYRWVPRDIAELVAAKLGAEISPG